MSGSVESNPAPPLLEEMGGLVIDIVLVVAHQAPVIALVKRGQPSALGLGYKERGVFHLQRLEDLVLQELPEGFPGNHFDKRPDHIVPQAVIPVRPRLKSQRHGREGTGVFAQRIGALFLQILPYLQRALLRHIVHALIGNAGAHGEKITHRNRARRGHHGHDVVARVAAHRGMREFRKVFAHRVAQQE